MKALVKKLVNVYVVFATLISISKCTDDVWEKVPCDVYFMPENCDFERLPLLTVEDFDRCGPAQLNLTARNYYLGATGRRITYNANKQAYKSIAIVPKILRDVSESSLETSTMGQRVSLPIGFSPVALQVLAHPHGEIATARAMSDVGTVMILSSFSSTLLEEVAAHAKGGSSHLWMQTYIFRNRSLIIDLVRRAERAGFQGIVVTVDAPVDGRLSCDARSPQEHMDLVNLGLKIKEIQTNRRVTFKDITWLAKITKLPVIAKGVLSPSEAVRVIRAGASAVLVSNHGGRQMDSAPPTIDVLPEIVDALNNMRPRRDVYVDGGIRNGWDVYKAIASGAKMVFVGRPQVWGLAMGGEAGVRRVLNILREEFEEAMLLSGAANPSQISRNTLIRK